MAAIDCIQTFVPHELGMLDNPQINPNEPTPVFLSHFEDEIDYPDKVYADLSNSGQKEFVEEYLDLPKTQTDNNLENLETINSLEKVRNLVIEDSKNEEQHYRVCHPAEQDEITKLEKPVESKKRTLQQYICELCSETFYRKGDLKIHHKASHLRKYICHICKHCFKSRTVLLKHVKSTHNMTVFNYYSFKNANYNPRETNKLDKNLIRKEGKTKMRINKRGRKPKAFDNLIMKEVELNKQTGIKSIELKNQSTGCKDLVGIKRKRGRPRKYPIDESKLTPSKPKEIKTYRCEKIAKLELRKIDEIAPGNKDYKLSKEIQRGVNPSNMPKNNEKPKETVSKRMKLVENENKPVGVEEYLKLTKNKFHEICQIKKLRVLIPKIDEVPQISQVTTKTNANVIESKLKERLPIGKQNQAFKPTSTRTLRHSKRKIKPVKMSGFIYTLKEKHMEDRDSSKVIEENFDQDFSTKKQTDAWEVFNPLTNENQENPKVLIKCPKLKENECNNLKIIINRVRKPKILPDFLYDVKTNSTLKSGTNKIFESLKPEEKNQLGETKTNNKIDVKKIIINKVYAKKATDGKINQKKPSETKMRERNITKHILELERPINNAKGLKSADSNVKTNEKSNESSPKVNHTAQNVPALQTVNTEISQQTIKSPDVAKIMKPKPLSTPKEILMQTITPAVVTLKVATEISQSTNEVTPETKNVIMSSKPYVPLSTDISEKPEGFKRDNEKPTIKMIELKENKDLHKEVGSLLKQNSQSTISMPLDVSKSSTHNLLIPPLKVIIGNEANSIETKITRLKANRLDSIQINSLCVAKKKNILVKATTIPSINILPGQNLSKKRSSNVAFSQNSPTVIKTYSISSGQTTGNLKEATKPNLAVIPREKITSVVKTPSQRLSNNLTFKGLNPNQKIKPEFARKSSPYNYTCYYDNKIVKPMSIVVDKMKENVFQQILQRK